MTRHRRPHFMTAILTIALACPAAAQAATPLQHKAALPAVQSSAYKPPRAQVQRGQLAKYNLLIALGITATVGSLLWSVGFTPVYVWHPRLGVPVGITGGLSLLTGGIVMTAVGTRRKRAFLGSLSPHPSTTSRPMPVVYPSRGGLTLSWSGAF